MGYIPRLNESSKRLPLRILDTTLRDGDQSACGSFAANDKVSIAALLDEAGVDVIEAGFPSSSRIEARTCESIARLCSKAAVAVMCRAIPGEIERAARAVRRARTPVIHVSLPVSDLHLRVKLGITRSECLERARAAIRVARDFSDEVELGAEDATRADAAFLLEYCEIACDAGARVINLADTAGLAEPEELAARVRALIATVPAFAEGRSLLSVHAHNDMGLALSNTLAAVRAGCAQAEVTVGGIGERSGNAALEELVANLRARADSYGVQTAVDPERLAPLARLVSSSLGIPMSPFKPIVGSNARSHAAGMHQQGLSRDVATYSPPVWDIESCKGARIVLTSHSGGKGVIDFAREIAGANLDPERASLILNRIKERGGACGISEFLGLMNEEGCIDAPLLLIERATSSFFTDRVGSLHCEIDATLRRLPDGMIVRARARDPSPVEAAKEIIRGCAGANLTLTSVSFWGQDGSHRVNVEGFVPTRHVPPGKTRVVERKGKDHGYALLECLVDLVNAAVASGAMSLDIRDYGLET